MFNMHTTIGRGWLAAAALLAIGAPAAEATLPPEPPSAHVTETGVPAGQTEHGVFVSTNVNDPHWKFYRRVEYWATSDRWMATATDRAGRLIDVQLGGPEGWTTYTGPNRRRAADGTIVIPAVQVSSAHQLPPFPGYGAPANQEALASHWFIPVAGAKPQTIAGFTGTVYRQDRRRSNRGELDTVVLQDGTLQPLLRENKLTRLSGHARAIDFQDRLVSREEVASASAKVQLTHQTYVTTLRGWRAKVRAYKQRAAGAKKHTAARPSSAPARAPEPKKTAGY